MPPLPTDKHLLQSVLTMTKQTTAIRWNTVAIYGVGLIGGSIGMALRKRELADRVVGIGRNAERLQRAVDLGAIHEFVTDPSQSPTPDLVVLCAPVQLLVEHCQAIASHFPDALITDAGSTKEKVVADVEATVPNAKFVGSHPLAGSDKSGAEYGNADLYHDRLVILTPTSSTLKTNTAHVEQFWESLGAKTVTMDPKLHDQALAITSHVPHIIASSLAATTPEEHLDLIAGGWRDTTRIAAADVELWTQILQENSQNVLESLQQVRSNIQEFETALAENNRDTLTRLLAAGKQRRDALGS